jgi:uncharacterized protein (TIGR02996 family)
MSEETNFLTSIAVDPWDEQVRIVYADWLEERGDARSDYVRIDSEVHSTLSFRRPRSTAARNEADALVARLSGLRREVDAGWLAVIDRPDWILIKGSGPDNIDQCIRNENALSPHNHPRDHDVFVHRLGRRTFGIRFCPPLHPYVLCDLVGWLADPSYNDGVILACCWVTAPRSGIRCFLTPPEDRIGSELLSGVTIHGRKVQFDRSRGELREIETTGPLVPEPRWLPESKPQVAVFTCIDELPGPNNPGFKEV